MMNKTWLLNYEMASSQNKVELKKNPKWIGEEITITYM